MDITSKPAARKIKAIAGIHIKIKDGHKPTLD